MHFLSSVGLLAVIRQCRMDSSSNWNCSTKNLIAPVSIVDSQPNFNHLEIGGIFTKIVRQFIFDTLENTWIRWSNNHGREWDVKVLISHTSFNFPLISTFSHKQSYIVQRCQLWAKVDLSSILDKSPPIVMIIMFIVVAAAYQFSSSSWSSSYHNHDHDHIIIMIIILS